MKLFSYQLIKRKQLTTLETEAAQQKKHIEQATTFIREIEKGNLDVQLTGWDDNAADNSLSESLLSMRSQMKKIALEEKERNWATEGLAKFVEILRSNNQNDSDLADQIISNLTKYMGANQGALYIVKDEDKNDVHLEMVACYAYNRKKFLHKRCELGEGMAGQVVLEKNPIYLTNLPPDYVRITSGLGEALPRHLLVAPLKIEENVLGVVEIASFEPIQPYKIRFVERLGESIASTIFNVRVNERTKLLLAESQQQTEEMKSQEEEMRQNMEELTATQEEMQRVMKEVQQKEGYLNQIINITRDSIYTVDAQYKLTSWNAAFAKTLAQFNLRPEKGLAILDWYKGEERNVQIKYLRRVFSGESFDVATETENQGTMYYFHISYAPVKNEHGEVFEAAIFTKDVTAMTAAQKNAENLAYEARQQAEQIKAQEEAMRQNIEELSATQEEVSRVLAESQMKERLLDELINVSQDAIFTIDHEYKMLTYNHVFEKNIKNNGYTAMKGMDALALYASEEEKLKHKALFDRALKGETFEVTSRYGLQDQERNYQVRYAPLRDVSGRIMAAAVYARYIA